MIIRNLSNTDPSVRQHKVSKNFTVIQQNKFRDTVPVIGNIKSLNIHSHPTEPISEMVFTVIQQSRYQRYPSQLIEFQINIGKIAIVPSNSIISR